MENDMFTKRVQLEDGSFLRDMLIRDTTLRQVIEEFDEADTRLPGSILFRAIVERMHAELQGQMSKEVYKQVSLAGIAIHDVASVGSEVNGNDVYLIIDTGGKS